MGKGSKRRPRSVSYEQYAANWDAAFGRRGRNGFDRMMEVQDACRSWSAGCVKSRPQNLNCQASLCNGGLEPTPVESLRPRDLTTGRNSGSSWANRR